MRTPLAIWMAVIGIGLSSAGAQTCLSEPDAVIYGTVTIDGKEMTAEDHVTVSARLLYDPNDPGSTDPDVDEAKEYELASYQLGGDDNVGDYYVLRIPLQWDVSNSEIVFATRIPVGNNGKVTVRVKNHTILLYVQDHQWAEAEIANTPDGTPAALSLKERGWLAPIPLDLSVDSDKDGLYDRWERDWGLDPNSKDTDGDGVFDNDEVNYDGDPNHLNTYDPYNPGTGKGIDLNATSVDTDGDGMADALEVRWLLNGVLADAYSDYDGDGYLNWEEVTRERNPNDPGDIPPKYYVYVDDDTVYPSEEYTPDGNTPDDPFKTIQEGVSFAISGDEVILMDGLYTGPGNVDVEVSHKAITIAADSNEYGPDYAVIDCANLGRAFLLICDSNDVVTLRGLTIKNGFAPNGAAVYSVGGTSIFENCLLAHNFAEADGGAVFFLDGNEPNLVNVTLADNMAAGNGGAVYCERTRHTTIVNSILFDNIATVGNQVYLAAADPWHPEDGSGMLVSYSNLVTDESSVYVGSGCDFNDVVSTNLADDPLFASLGYGYWDSNGTAMPQDDIWLWVDGDYHLKSQIGYWNASAPNGPLWATDDVTSTCIDAGDPGWPIGEELIPHGGRINMGAYGGTREASLSPAAGDGAVDANGGDGGLM